MDCLVKRVEENGVETYRIESWERQFARLSAGFSTRNGGISEGGFASLNCALHVADEPKHVLENRRRLAEAAGFSFEAWTCGEQVHHNDVAVVTRQDRGRGRDSRESAIPDTDALITDVPDIMLVSFYADCVPIFYYDPIRQAAGLAHAGWKGTAKRIAARTVEQFRAAFGSEPEHIRAAIGPSIGQCCYEVDNRVIQAMQESGITEGWMQKSNDKFMLDLREINRQILIEAGILPSHIEVTHLCTSCHVESFYSHRRDGGRTGRMASWIGIV
jgi:hypothetical protein